MEQILPSLFLHVHVLHCIHLSFINHSINLYLFLKDLEFGVEQGVDIIFASFIRKAQDVHEVRAQLGEKGKNIRIISKV